MSRPGVEPVTVDRPLEQRLQRAFDGVTYVAALVTAPVVIARAFDIPDGVETALAVANWLCWAAFAGLDVFRVVRLLRGRYARRLADGVTSTEGLRNVALITLLTVGFGGFAFSEIEPGIDVGDGLYWAVTTVTTTGYGDIVPTTEAGKALAMAIMVIGAGFLAVLTGALAQRFVGRWQGGGGGSEPSAAPVATAPAQPQAPAAPAATDPVLAKLDELGERLARLERAVTRGG